MQPGTVLYCALTLDMIDLPGPVGLLTTRACDVKGPGKGNRARVLKVR